MCDSLRRCVATNCSNVYGKIRKRNGKKEARDTENTKEKRRNSPIGRINPLNTKLNPICNLLALLKAHHFLQLSRIRVKKGYRPRTNIVKEDKGDLVCRFPQYLV